MTGVWITIVALVIGTAAMKAVGPLALGGRRIPDRVFGVIRMIAPSLLAALVVYETFNTGSRGIRLDARVVGVVAAAVGLALRLPVIVVVLIAAAATALVRAIGWRD